MLPVELLTAINRTFAFDCSAWDVDIKCLQNAHTDPSCLIRFRFGVLMKWSKSGKLRYFIP